MWAPCSLCRARRAVSDVACFIRCGSSSLVSIVVFLPFVKEHTMTAPTLSIERRAVGMFRAVEHPALVGFVGGYSGLTRDADALGPVSVRSVVSATTVGVVRRCPPRHRKLRPPTRRHRPRTRNGRTTGCGPGTWRRLSPTCTEQRRRRDDELELVAPELEAASDRATSILSAKDRCILRPSFDVPQCQ